jgi:hypothetical protein
VYAPQPEIKKEFLNFENSKVLFFKIEKNPTFYTLRLQLGSA